ncbi:MAG: hypothetical protein LQ347_005102, partial [Umbilicaria vellea]
MNANPISGTNFHLSLKNTISLEATLAMSHFRAKRLDLGCFVNIRVIRDHTK